MKLAYADPPYIGQARKHYKDQPLCAEVDHAALIEQLVEYDGWALSLSSTTLHIILPMCPDFVRVGAWVKPFCSFKPGVNPAYAWEPVIFKPARALGRDVYTVRDFVSANITLKRGVHGAKPIGFCNWLFDILGAKPQDEFCDMFPGSGAVTLAWDIWSKQMRFTSWDTEDK